MDRAEGQPMDRSRAGTLPALRAQIEGDGRVQPHSEPDGQGIDQVLNGIDQGEGGHGCLADLGHEKAVHNIVEGVDQHGQHHGQGHGDDQRQDGPLPHERFVHRFGIPPEFQKKATQRPCGQLCGEKGPMAGKIHNVF